MVILQNQVKLTAFIWVYDLLSTLIARSKYEFDGHSNYSVLLKVIGICFCKCNIYMLSLKNKGLWSFLTCSFMSLMMGIVVTIRTTNNRNILGPF